MASLLFVMRYPLHKDDNLKIKFDGQMAAARALGHQAFFIGWDESGMWLCGDKERKLLKKSAFTHMPAYEKTLLYVDLMDAVERASQAHRFDAMYMRFLPTFHNAPRAIQAFKQSDARVIVEHPTYPFENGKTTSLLRMPVFKYNAHVFAKINPMVDLFALIGDLCGETLDGRPAMNIVNGVNVDCLPLHAPRANTPEIGMLALASMSDWQGYDRLIRALAAYTGDAEVTLHMVGNEGDGSLAAWKRLSVETGVAHRVLFHGELHGDALNKVVAKCDIGVGGLGLYRKAQFCSMTLKLREYMGRGLPFAYAVDDPSIPNEPRFCLRLSNDAQPIELDALVQFAVRAKTDEEAPALMRAYAREHMSWTGVLRSVLERAGIPCHER